LFRFSHCYFDLFCYYHHYRRFSPCACTHSFVYKFRVQNWASRRLRYSSWEVWDATSVSRA
jgi:hypothetical protein